MFASSSVTRFPDHPLFGAGVHEQQIFLAVVEEAEVLLVVVVARRNRDRLGRGHRLRRHHRARRLELLQRGLMRARDHRRAGEGGVAVRRHEGADAVERFGRDAAAVAKAARELAVVDGAPSERGFGEAGGAAVFGDFLKQLLRIHWRRPGFLTGPARRRSRRLIRRWTDEIRSIPGERVNHKFAHYPDGQVDGLLPITRNGRNTGKTENKVCERGRITNLRLWAAPSCPLSAHPRWLEKSKELSSLQLSVGIKGLLYALLNPT